LLHDGLLHHRQDFVVVGEDFFDQGGHVVVGVFGKAAAESDVGLAVGEVVVAGIDGGVAHVVDGVERFHAFAVFEGIFFDDDGLGGVGTFFVEVFVLADADVVVLGGVVGDDAAGLCPGFVDDFGLEAYRAVVETPEAVVEVFIDFAGEDGVKKMRVLSGGEKVRVLLSRMMIMGSNVLIFDEPTDHLDMESITALNNGMIKFPGVILFACRDHQVVQTTANRIIEFLPDGSMVDKVSTYDEYLESDVMARKRQVYNTTADEEADD